MVHLHIWYISAYDELFGDWSFAPVSSYQDFPDVPFERVILNEHPGGGIDDRTLKGNSHVTFAGRRNRALASLCRYQYRSEAHHTHWFSSSLGGPDGKPLFVKDHRMTFREGFEELQGDSESAEEARAYLSKLPLRYHGLDRIITEIPEKMIPPARTHFALHDMALQIRRDLREAIDAQEQGGYYPGVDEGIDPVSDDHVALVLWGAQRELNQELRPGPNGVLPAYPLSRLSPAVARAYAERRRLRFKEWGITHENWSQNEWSIFNVPDDDWYPPWSGERK